MQDWIDSLIVGGVASVAGALAGLIAWELSSHPAISKVIVLSVAAGLFATGTMRALLWLVDRLGG